jgi:hypothetical protein
MELYDLAGIVFLMIAALVVTREPEEDSASWKPVHNKRGGTYVPRLPAEPLSRRVAHGKGTFGGSMEGHESA